MTRARIGLDIGGSAIKAGRISDAGTVEARMSWPIPAGFGSADVADALADLAHRLAPELAPASIGIGLPGLLDRRLGCVTASPNLPWLAGVRLVDSLAARIGIPAAMVRIENDANCAATAEHWLGAARGIEHALVLTLGTGIGGGLILNGALYAGEGLAGEIGHVTVDPRGPRCGCGARGCLETLASASAARRRARDAGLPRQAPGDLEQLAAAARTTPGAERDLLLAVGRDLGRGLASALCLLDLRTFVVGGGFSAALDVLEPGVRAGLAERAYGERAASVRIVPAALGASAGWIGAARMAFDQPRIGP